MDNTQLVREEKDDRVTISGREYRITGSSPEGREGERHRIEVELYQILRGLGENGGTP